eukprot:scaffold2604_cov198-Alexandrium_tamarense.AAC.28
MHDSKEWQALGSDMAAGCGHLYWCGLAWPLLGRGGQFTSSQTANLQPVEQDHHRPLRRHPHFKISEARDERTYKEAAAHFT